MRLKLRGLLTLPEYLYLPLALALMILGGLMLVEVVWPLTVAGQRVSPARVTAPRVGDRTPARGIAIDLDEQEEPATEHTEEQMKEWEAEALHEYRVTYCHELAKRSGLHLFNTRFYVKCEFEEETIRIRNR